jgi:hypothetical protein
MLVGLLLTGGKDEMAGSYSMARKAWTLIENMGDAYEAVEQLLWLVQSQIGTEKATRLLDEQFYPMARGEKPKDKAWKQVQTAMKR